MKKFMLLYSGPATPPEQMTPEKSQEIMGNWKKWMDKVGAAMVDMGQPMATGAAVVDDGSSKDAQLLNGYSIIQAESLEEAKELTRDHPFLSDKTGEFSVEIFELLPTPTI